MEGIIFAIFTIILLLVLFKPKQTKGKEIPGPAGWPLVGNALEITDRNMPQKCFEFAERYGPICQLRLFNTNVILLNSVELFSKAVNGDNYKQFFNDRPINFYGEHFLFGSQGVAVFPHGFSDVHNGLRKALTKSLHVYGDGIQAFEDKVTSELKNVIRRLENIGQGEDLEFRELMRRSLTNLLSIFITGEGIDDNDPDVDIFWEYDTSLLFMFSAKPHAVYSKFPYIRHFPCVYKRHYDTLSELRDKLFDRFYKKLKATYKPGVIRGLVDSLLSQRENELKNGGDNVILTEERLQSSILELIAAAIATTLSSMSNIILCVMNHPECQAKAQKEIDDVIGRDRMPTLEDRDRCSYIEALIMETQRLITVVPLNGPHTCRSNLEFEGYDIPANSMVLPNLHYIHHNEKIWGSDAWEFKPERFLDKNGDILPRSHVFRRNWVPFSLGRRQCLGETFARSRIFLYTATLLQRWKFTPSPGKCGSCDPRTDDFDISFVTQSKPFYCRIEKRF